MSNRSSQVLIVVLVSALVPLSAGDVAAKKVPLAKQCRLQCPATIDACISAGGKKAKCRRQTLAACRKTKLAFCLPTTTTTTSTTSTTTSTIVLGDPPTITRIDPNNGLVGLPASGVRITGTNLRPAAQVSIGGQPVPVASCNYTGVPTRIVCTVPPGNAAGPADVMVTNPDTQAAVLPDGWTYTTVVDAVDFCNVQDPKDQLPDSEGPLPVNTPLDVTGRVLKVGLTDTFDTVAPGVRAQLGLSPRNPAGLDLDPTTSNSWRYFDAAPNPGYDFTADEDEYIATITPTATGSYLYAYRFSLDGGRSYTYCDADDTNDGFEAADLSQMSVVP